MGTQAVASRATTRPARTAISLLTCAALLTGCAHAISGTPTTPGTQAPDEVAGLPVTAGPSGPKPDAPDPRLPVEGTDHGPADRLARAAIADTTAFWRATFPETFGKEFHPVRRLVSYDSTGRGIDLCGHPTAGSANAFYCPAENTIAWDRGELLPTLTNTFGPMAAVSVLAHEMGHVVQHQAGTARPDDPALVLEQQADCFTGAYFRHVAEGKSDHFQISTGEGLNDVMATLAYFRDTPGAGDFTDTDAHGSAFDRISAFQHGFTEGPRRCAQLDPEEVKQRTTHFKFWKQQQETDLPVDEHGIAAVERSLREVFRDTGAAPPTITTEPQACGNRPETPPATYCPDTNTVSLDLPALQQIAQPPGKNTTDGGYGDFAAYAQIAARYTLSVQRSAGLSLTGDTASLRTACLVGAWSGLLVEDPIGQRNPVGKLRLAPGDIDEGIASLLSEDSLIAADADGNQVPSGFARVEAFRTGFQEGLGTCSTRYFD
ncbi:aminopeptidase [Saccharopolyspora rectivirgula]|jgi:predicted metalloprotease|uniref:Aminopeptidase n=1 Tax=Saccharopolyspora rectivirgula TaxID=28042 RepID=A0A073ATC1_9PSEU|nr:aminopeptidase [Saccharopolyspora rectivirgula]